MMHKFDLKFAIVVILHFNVTLRAFLSSGYAEFAFTAECTYAQATAAVAGQ